MECLAKLCKGEPQVFAPGIYFDVPRETYDNIPALSASVLKKWITYQAVPAEFAHWLGQRWTEAPSESLLMGSALDCMLLEPREFSNRFAVMPEDAPARPSSRQRNARKPSPASIDAIAWWDEFNERANGKAILTGALHTTVLEMMLSLRKAPTAQGVFEHCRKAVIVGDLFGIPSKCEIDLWNPNIPHILDLKTANDVRPEAFVFAARKFQYIEQAIFYLDLAATVSKDKDVFTFAAVRNSEPWSVMFYTFAPQAVPDHQVIYTRMGETLEIAAQSLVRHLDADDFANPPDWQFMEFPAWQVRQAAFTEFK